MSTQTPTLPHPVKGLREIAGNYDILLCDVWGVIHNGREHFPAACDALVQYNTGENRHVILISNSPRPATDVVAQLDQLGVPRDAWAAFVTSGDATRAELNKRSPGPVWAIGPDRDATLYEGIDLIHVDGQEDAGFICCTGLFDDETETPEDYRERLYPAAIRGTEMVCANPDRIVQRGDKIIYCGGALADLYRSMGGRVTMAGKPFAPIYNQAMKLTVPLMGRPADRARVLCIGDGVTTDVLGANRQKLDCLFIAKGIHGEAAHGPDGLIDPGLANALLQAETAHARYASLDLEW
ncbi:TIGR01459 family HAD-type hydrolase [soil metagenome]